MLLYTQALYIECYSRSHPADYFSFPACKVVPRAITGITSPCRIYICQTEETLANILQKIFECMLCGMVLSDSSWTIILIDIVCSDQVCVYYMLHHVKVQGEEIIGVSLPCESGPVLRARFT